MPPAVALLDLYDTLVWSEWSSLRLRMEERLGLPTHRLMDAFAATIRERGTGAYGSPEGDLRAVLEAAEVEPDADLLVELLAMERDHLETGIHFHEDALPVLRALRERGVPTALVSNCSHGTRTVVDRLGLEDEMDVVVLSFEARTMKPDPEIYLEALRRLGAAPEDAVFVDDQVAFIDGAEALGIPSLRIDRDLAEPPTGVVTSLYALLEPGGPVPR
ncbi:MAG: HAD family hydrolase [Actinomycetota bacterium]